MDDPTRLNWTLNSSYKTVSSKITVNCPTCATPVIWDTEHLWRPFCSERCRMIDLGAWADESHSIPVKTYDLGDIDNIMIETDLSDFPTENE